MINRLSLRLTHQMLSQFCPDLKLPDSIICSERIRPKDNVNIWINGRPVVAAWGLIPSSAENDMQQHNRIGIRTKDLSNSPTYRLLSRRNRAFIFINAFFHNTVKKGQRSRHMITHRTHSLFAVPVLYDYWTDPDDRQLHTTFSIVHRQVEKLDDQLPQVIPVLFDKYEQVEQWLNLENLPHQIQWPLFNEDAFRIQTKEMDLKMNPGYNPVVPSGQIPDNYKNIA